MVLAQLGKGKVNGKQLLPAKLIEQSQTQQIKGEGKFDEFLRDGYAWGWFTGNYKGKRMLHHLGGFAGTHALVSFMPEQNIGVIILNNEGHLSRKMTGIASSIAYDILLDQSNGEQLAKEGLNNITAYVEKFPAMFAGHYDKLKAREWLLSKPNKEYVGIYSHPLLGEIKVELDKYNVFNFSWGQLKTTALAYTKPDSMRVEMGMYSGSPVQFLLSNKKVSSLVYDGNTFQKQ